jgi:hypothetical protein
MFSDYTDIARQVAHSSSPHVRSLTPPGDLALHSLLRHLQQGEGFRDARGLHLAVPLATLPARCGHTPHRIAPKSPERAEEMQNALQ